MQRNLRCLLRPAGYLAAVASLLFGSAAGAADPWVTAYYPAYRYSTLPPSAIDMTSITHLVWFSLVPDETGAFTSGEMESHATAVAHAAHVAGVKALICIGGAGTEYYFRSTWDGGHTTDLVTNIVNWVAKYHYDGVDIDVEPMDSSDKAGYDAFIIALRKALPASKLLTCAAQNYAPVDFYSAVASKFNQINVMSYDLSGPYEEPGANGGRYTWHHTALSPGSYKIPGTTTPMASASGSVGLFRSAGVPAAKLGLGVAFYGYSWNGATAPNRAFTFTGPQDAPTNWGAVTHADIMANYYSASAYHYDASVHAPYLSLPATNTFITYEDQSSIFDKVSYLKSSALGGLVLWELGQETTQQPLLAALNTDLTIPFGQTVAIKSVQTGRYVSCNASAANSLTAAIATTVSTAEKFKVINASSQHVMLQSLLTGKYVSLNTASNSLLTANTATTTTAAAKFSWSVVSDGVFALKSVTGGHFVSVDTSTSSDYVRAATATTVSPKEQFTFVLQ